MLSAVGYTCPTLFSLNFTKQHSPQGGNNSRNFSTSIFAENSASYKSVSNTPVPFWSPVFSPVNTKGMFLLLSVSLDDLALNILDLCYSPPSHLNKHQNH